MFALINSLRLLSIFIVDSQCNKKALIYVKLMLKAINVHTTSFVHIFIALRSRKSTQDWNQLFHPWNYGLLLTIYSKRVDVWQSGNRRYKAQERKYRYIFLYYLKVNEIWHTFDVIVPSELTNDSRCENHLSISNRSHFD